ncbi:MAG: alanyl-tRNA editing protein, partial [Alphaproteobacteria bacterium]|nr:alanyl-tRNA editing protein [Alphaproteobacteria bacterium]
MSTNLLYMDNSQLYEYKAKVMKIEALEDGSKALVLNESIFYPKGGGQPCDKGIITFDKQNIV